MARKKVRPPIPALDCSESELDAILTKFVEYSLEARGYLGDFDELIRYEPPELIDSKVREMRAVVKWLSRREHTLDVDDLDRYAFECGEQAKEDLKEQPSR